MSQAPGTDLLHVVNGPEDGVGFPLVRTPVEVGSDPAAPIRLSLDPGVEPLHALVTVVSEGYRVRRTAGEPVFVDGKRAGMFRSRVLRDGQMIQVGQTLLCLECAPGGLAKRSRGMASQSDLVWTLTSAVRGLGRAARGLVNFMLRVFGRLMSSWLAIAGLAFLIIYFVPSIRYWVLSRIYQVYYAVAQAFLNR